MQHKRDWRNGKNRLDFDAIPFWDLHRMDYEHAGKMDQHLPFLAEGLGDLIQRIDPEYITFEFVQRSKEEYRQFIVGRRPGEAAGVCVKVSYSFLIDGAADCSSLLPLINLRDKAGERALCLHKRPLDGLRTSNA